MAVWDLNLGLPEKLIYSILQKGSKMGLVPQSDLFYQSLCPSAISKHLKNFSTIVWVFSRSPCFPPSVGCPTSMFLFVLFGMVFFTISEIFCSSGENYWCQSTQIVSHTCVSTLIVIFWCILNQHFENDNFKF